jgi:hypothetical protein
MAGTTTRLKLPYPEESDNINEGATKIKELATKLDEIAVASVAPTIIATEQERTNTAYGLLATPDEVTVVLPTNGLIAVAYQASWSQSVSGAGRAEIFLESNSVDLTTGGGPGSQIAATYAGTEFTALATNPLGLSSVNPSTYKAYVTTGTFLGIEGKTGGPCYIFAAAGTYKVSVQFAATSGKVAAKERKLWAWVVA